jgi:hypothetical protein
VSNENVCGCKLCPFPPCPCGEDHGSCPGGLCRDCYHEMLFKRIDDHERENPGALEKRLAELVGIFGGKAKP